MTTRKPAGVRSKSDSIRYAKNRIANAFRLYGRLAPSFLPDKMVRVEAPNNFYLCIMGTEKVFFIRGPRGAITALWTDPAVQIISMRSAKVRHAPFKIREPQEDPAHKEYRLTFEHRKDSRK